MALGVLHPDYLLPHLSSRQLAEWEAYRRIKPFGADMDDWRMAMICCAIANFSGNVDRKKRPQGMVLKDFLPLRREKKKSSRAMKAIWAMIAEASGGANEE